MITMTKVPWPEEIEAKEALTHYNPKDVEAVKMSYNIIIRYAPFWDVSYKELLDRERTIWSAWDIDTNLFDELFTLVSKTQFVIEEKEDE